MTLGCERLEGVFIRAPQISAVGSEVQVLATCRGEPVLVRQGNVWGATFHPELSREPALVYQAVLTWTSPLSGQHGDSKD